MDYGGYYFYSPSGGKTFSGKALYSGIYNLIVNREQITRFIVLGYDGNDDKAEERRLLVRKDHLKLAQELTSDGSVSSNLKIPE